jgi:hypothetical protein
MNVHANEIIINPYIAGPPVRGRDFYNRNDEIGQVLGTNIKLISFIATRRMGKTSLCQQIRHVCCTDPGFSGNICILWDLQGRKDEASAKEGLLTPSNRLALKVDQEALNQLSALPNCGRIIEEFCAVYGSGQSVLLMIDEPDILVDFANREECYGHLSALKDAFDDIPNLRVVMVGPPRILDLLCVYPNAPLILDNFQIHYLREFGDPEARNLIAQTQRHNGRPATPPSFLASDSRIVDNIIDISNKVPFYIQKICLSIFDHSSEIGEASQKRLDQIIEDIIELQNFHPYFTSDFQELHSIKKIMLLDLAHSPIPLDSQTLIDSVKGIAPKVDGMIPTQKYIDELVDIGLIKVCAGGAYDFSNRLFNQWILRDFDNLWNQTMEKIESQKKFDKEILHPHFLKLPDLEKMEAELMAFRKIIDELDRDHEDAKIDDPVFFRKKMALLRDHALLINRLRNHLSYLGAAHLANLLTSILGAENDVQEVQKWEKIEAEATENGWDNIVQEQIGDGSRGTLQLMNIAFNVAKYLAEQNLP